MCVIGREGVRAEGRMSASDPKADIRLMAVSDRDIRGMEDEPAELVRPRVSDVLKRADNRSISMRHSRMLSANASLALSRSSSGNGLQQPDGETIGLRRGSYS